MSKSKSPEMKQLLGHREDDDDGFTYLYGKSKGGYGVKSKRNIDSIGKQVRHDKRAVKAAEIRRIENEIDQEQD